MKKIIILIFIFCGVLSCEDFLEEKPKNQVILSTFFTSPEDAAAIINNLYYRGVPTFYNDAGFEGTSMMMSGYMAGLFDNGRKERPGPIEAQHLTITPVNLNSELNNWFFSCYVAISQANVALKNIPGIEQLSNGEINKYMAEAIFFRALNYFYLVKNFGDVPLITEPYEDLSNIYAKREAAELVYEQIINDLEWALNNGELNSVPFHLNGFRITRGAVAALLADIYLQTAGFPLNKKENYEKAAYTAKTIINSGEYEMIKNGNIPEESAYNVMRTSDTEREYIYSIECDDQLRRRGLAIYTISTHAAPPNVKVGDFPWNGYQPLKEYVNIYYPDKDLRIHNKQLFHNQIEKDGINYDFGEWAPYLWYKDEVIYETGRDGGDISVYRYPEILLITAEAIAYSEGVTNEAISYLTDVRSRAYWETERNQIETELMNLSKEQFIEEVWKERLRELPLNFKTWSDIQRTRKYPVSSASSPGEVNFVDVIGHTNPFGATYKAYNLLYPISEIDLQRNPELYQNEGY
jgi:starch-binding outer membrane protein, SusD/RagB family